MKATTAMLAIVMASYGCATTKTSGEVPPSVANDSGPPVDAGSPLDASSSSTLDDAGCVIDPGVVAGTKSFGGDAGANPIAPSAFTLDDALADFAPRDGRVVIVALIRTAGGTIRCELFERAAPVTVANFVGLARGTRPFFSEKTAGWQTGRFFDGLLWHRVVPNFVIQSGDPTGDGSKNSGYSLPKENQVPQALGTLGMASNAITSEVDGSQFYVVVGSPPGPNYNVFGLCDTAVAAQVAAVPRDADDRPLVATPITSVEIRRCPRR